jgi:hypothetical protein
VDEVDEVVVLKPEQCTHCQAPLLGEDPKPWRHQVIELPPIKPVVTEYQWHQLVCSECGEVTLGNGHLYVKPPPLELVQA